MTGEMIYRRNKSGAVWTYTGEEIVRCRECKHFIDHRCRKIRTLEDWRKDNDFCSYGEEKEEE